MKRVAWIIWGMLSAHAAAQSPSAFDVWYEAQLYREQIEFSDARARVARHPDAARRFEALYEFWNTLPGNRDEREAGLAMTFCTMRLSLVADRLIGQGGRGSACDRPRNMDERAWTRKVIREAITPGLDELDARHNTRRSQRLVAALFGSIAREARAASDTAIDALAQECAALWFLAALQTDEALPFRCAAHTRLEPRFTFLMKAAAEPTRHAAIPRFVETALIAYRDCFQITDWSRACVVNARVTLDGVLARYHERQRAAGGAEAYAVAVEEFTTLSDRARALDQRLGTLTGADERRKLNAALAETCRALHSRYSEMYRTSRRAWAEDPCPTSR